MSKINLELKLNKKDIENIMKRNHFSGEDIKKISSLVEAALPLVSANAYYNWLDEEKSNAICFVTLGEGIDKLQDLYFEMGCLSEGFMLDCIGLELLSKAYEEFVKKLQITEKRWALRIDFLDEKEIEKTPELLSGFSDIEISCNSQFVLSPKKSVSFYLPVGCEAVDFKACNICHNCGNSECMFRKLDDSQSNVEHLKKFYSNVMKKNISDDTKQVVYSYGVSQVFGLNK